MWVAEGEEIGRLVSRFKIAAAVSVSADGQNDTSQ